MINTLGIELACRLSMWIAAARRRAGDDRGNSLVEYAMLVAFISMVAISAMSLLGGPAADGLSAGADGFAP